MTMQINEAVEILRTHNEWRRGAEIERQHPIIIGEAIDSVIEYFDRNLATKEMKAILDAIDSELGVSYEALCSDSRLEHIAEARHIFAYICITKHHYTNKRIGQVINRSHSSISASFARASIFYEINDVNFNAKLRKVENYLFEKTFCL